MDIIINVMASMLGIIIGSVLTIVIISMIVKFIDWLKMKLEDNKMKTYRITYVRSCTWGGKRCELATYDVKRDAVCYYVQARKYEQAVAKLFKNKGFEGKILIVDINYIVPAK